MRRLLSLLPALLLMALAANAGAEAATQVGAVSRTQGAAVGTSEGKTVSLTVGAPVYLAEVIATNIGGRVEITFEDGTKVTIGEKAKVTIDAFLYRPRSLGNTIKLGITGPFRFVSGKLTKSAASSASVVTPMATIGIRGTDFWGGPIDGAYGVFLKEGAVTVTAGTGDAVLDRPGEGVNLTPLLGTRGRPGPRSEIRGDVSLWSPEKAARALATVSFE